MHRPEHHKVTALHQLLAEQIKLALLIELLLLKHR